MEDGLPRARRRLKVAHVITNLEVGGAQLMLLKLSKIMKDRFDLRVVSLSEVGAVGERLQDLGIPVIALGMAPARPDPRGLARLVRCFRSERPHVVQSWMYHADLASTVANRLAGSAPSAWGIRQTLGDELNKRSTLTVAKVCAHMSSYLPTAIVCCSEASRRTHVEFGYAARKMVVIPNGFDLERFTPNAQARADVRAELGIPVDAPLVGLMARFHPQKDHRMFLLAAELVRVRHPNAHFLLAGEGVERANPELRAHVDFTGLTSKVHFLGLRNDIPRLTASLDVACSSSSFGEGFPNAIGEALACGVPCVVTDVGDSRWIVGEAGRVVPPHDPHAFAGAIDEVLRCSSSERERLSRSGRERVSELFDIRSVEATYADLYERLALAGSNARRTTI